MGSMFFLAIEKKKETRSKSRETRTKRQEARDKRQEPRAEKRLELFAVRFICACLPQAGLCAFASKKKKETRSERQEPRSLSADWQARGRAVRG
jgi:hypothetical protein